MNIIISGVIFQMQLYYMQSSRYCDRAEHDRYLSTQHSPVKNSNAKFKCLIQKKNKTTNEEEALRLYREKARLRQQKFRERRREDSDKW